MANESSIPLSLADVTTDYLTMALREAGVLGQAHVTDLQSRVIGEGAGFMGDVVELTVAFSSDSSSESSSESDDGEHAFVLKIPTATKNREVGQTLGVYEREIRFYRDLQPLLDIRTPRHFFSAMDEAVNPETALKGLKALDKMPLWLIRLLFPLLNRMSARRSSHYVLILEHLRSYRVGDQIAGCSHGESQRVLDSMATMHAQFRETRLLDRFPWLVPYRYVTKPFQMMYLQASESFKSRYADVLTPQAVHLIDWLRDHYFEITMALAQRPSTLVHGDFRLDNLCFDDEAGDVILFDWQTLGIGCGAVDLAYFLSAAITEDAAEGTAYELIEYYREQLSKRGVHVSAEALRWEFDVCLLMMLHRLVPAEFQDMLDLGDGRGNELLATWMARIMTHIQGIDPDALLASQPAPVATP